MGFYCHQADDDEIEALRLAFGDKLREAIFYDAEEGDGEYGLIVAYGADGKQFDEIDPEDPRWYGPMLVDGPTLSPGDIPGHRGHTTKFSLEVPEPEPAECEGHESLAGAHMGQSVFCDGTCV